ncbi:MAG: HugZ family protein [Bacillota bacterium]
MDAQLEWDVRGLLAEQHVGSLGTVHDGEPFVSMVPFAVLEDGDIVIHVSALAAHTQHMAENCQVSLLAIAQQTGSVPPQALARLAIQGEAMRLVRAGPRHEEAQKAYLECFPESAQMFTLGDFSLFTIHPTSVRFVGGFARARTLTPETFARIVARS